MEIPLELAVSIGAAIAGVGVSYGVVKGAMAHNTKDIEELKADPCMSKAECVGKHAEIQNSLTRLHTKVGDLSEDISFIKGKMENPSRNNRVGDPQLPPCQLQPQTVIREYPFGVSDND